MRNFIILLNLLLAITACKTDDSSAKYDTSITLNNVTDNIILTGYQELANNTSLLQGNIDVLKSNITEENLIIVQNSFLSTYTTWQKISMFEFGPSVDEALTSLNIYPTNIDRINDNILNGNYNLESASNIVSTGLPALDYLLFNDTKANILIKLADLNYLNYLVAVTEQLATKSNTVNNNWKNSYSATFKASTAIDAGSSISILANAFILNFEKNGREAKIGIPAGVRTLNEAIPSNVESFYSGNSIALAKEQIAILKNIYEGNGSENYKAILTGLGKKALADNISSDFIAIETSLNTLTDPFSDMLTADNQTAISTYAEYQKLLPLLKVDMTAALGLLITYSDSDGD